jgi:shikimate kinase
MNDFPTFIVGFTAVGKSTLGKKLAAKLSIPFIDLDSLIEEKSRKSIQEIFNQHGENYFRKLESETLKSIPIKAAVVSCGGGTPCFFDNMDWMNLNGKTIYLKAPLNFILNNIFQSDINKRPLLNGMNQDEIKAWAKKLLEIRAPFYLKAQYIILSSSL